jgi:hypothetical protein
VGREVKWVLLLAVCSLLLSVSIKYPHFLSDTGNEFLRDFVGVNLLSVLGFITAVGNAATLSIFLHLNQLDDNADFAAKRTKRSLKLSAVSLVYVFSIAFVAVVLKGIFGSDERAEALFNSVGIVAVFFSLSVLRDLTLTVFAIPTVREVKKWQEQNRLRSGK